MGARDLYLASSEEQSARKQQQHLEREATLRQNLRERREKVRGGELMRRETFDSMQKICLNGTSPQPAFTCDADFIQGLTRPLDIQFNRSFPK